MKLIDADKLCDWIKTECNPYGKPTIDFETGCRVIDFIERMPTAFDKEKVIKELQNISLKFRISGNFNSSAVADRSIEIIEKGGIE